MREFKMEHVGQMLNKEKKPPADGQDPNVASELRPARLTYAGKELSTTSITPRLRLRLLKPSRNGDYQ